MADKDGTDSDERRMALILDGVYEGMLHDPDTWEEDFEAGWRETVERHWRLHYDFGLDRTDIRDIVHRLAQRYQLDLEGFRAASFGPPSWRLWPPLWPERFYVLTVQDLIDLSCAGSWKASGIDERVRKWRLSGPWLYWFFSWMRAS